MELSPSDIACLAALLGWAFVLCVGAFLRGRDRVMASFFFECGRCHKIVSDDEGGYDCQPELCDVCWGIVHEQAACIRCAREDRREPRLGEERR